MLLATVVFIDTHHVRGGRSDVVLLVMRLEGGHRGVMLAGGRIMIVGARKWDQRVRLMIVQLQVRDTL